MAPVVQDPEIILAQRLASNEKSTRTQAIKKLRKYIQLRSKKQEGGFTEVDLLKIWKGLFYCLWMQDKPLLQEELSGRISGLLHSFQTIDSQLLFFETFLQTTKREWNGIDRLRMDKFYQLVRFVFREAFILLKRAEWENSLVGRFLDLFATQLLQSSNPAPAGLMLHILELYLTELAQVGSTELTAEQNQTFIDPFCKTMAKTKDRILFMSISSNIFSAIVDQAPFAIEDLIREVTQEKRELDSGQASEEEEEEEEEKEEKDVQPKSKSHKKGKQLNGTKRPSEDDDIDSEEDDMLNVDDMDLEKTTEDDEIEPVLQFDYGAVADRLFTLASKTNTRTFNRNKIYKLVKILRDISEGVFPQDEDPEEVSTDEDDDFSSRKRRRRKRRTEEEKDEESPAKKRKTTKKKEESDQDKSDPAVDPSDDTSIKKKKKKRKRKTKKTRKSEDGQSDAKHEEESPEEMSAEVTHPETDEPELTTPPVIPGSEKTGSEQAGAPTEPTTPAECNHATESKAAALASNELHNTAEMNMETTPLDTSAEATTQPEDKTADADLSQTEGETEGQFEAQITESQTKSGSKKRRRSKKVKAASKDPEEVVTECPSVLEAEESKDKADKQSTPDDQEGEDVLSGSTLTDATPKLEHSAPTPRKKKRAKKQQETAAEEQPTEVAEGKITDSQKTSSKATEESLATEPAVDGTAHLQETNKGTQSPTQADDQNTEPEAKPQTDTEAACAQEVTQEPEKQPADASIPTPLKKRTRSKKKKTAQAEETSENKTAEQLEPEVIEQAEPGAVNNCEVTAAPHPAEAEHSNADVSETQPAGTSTPTPPKKKKGRKKKKTAQVEEITTETETAHELEPTVTIVSDPAVMEENCTDVNELTLSRKKLEEMEVECADEVAQEQPADISALTPVNKKRRSKKNKIAQTEEDTSENQTNLDEGGQTKQGAVIHSEVIAPSDPAVIEDTGAGVHKPTPSKKKKQNKIKPTPTGESQSEVGCEPQLGPVVDGADAQPADAGEELVATDIPTALKKKKRKHQKKEIHQEEQSTEMHGPSNDASHTEATPSDSCTVTPQKTSKKKKRKMMEEQSQVNGNLEVGMSSKRTKISAEAEQLFTPLGTKSSQKKMKKLKQPSPEADFCKFKTQATVPTPLFWKTKANAGSSTPQASKKVIQTPKSELKKVTFGLKNNKTAEFRKSDRSLSVSPVGSSRVAFDPRKTPKCGVLKSPASSPASFVKKSSTQMKRPTAADFF